MYENEAQLADDQFLIFNPAPEIGGPDWEWHQASFTQKNISREDAEACMKRYAQILKITGGYVFNSGSPLLLEFAIPLSLRAQLEDHAHLLGVQITRWGGTGMDLIAMTGRARLAQSDHYANVRRFGTWPPPGRFLDDTIANAAASGEGGGGAGARKEKGKGSHRPFWGGPVGPCLEMFDHGGKNAVQRAQEEAVDASSRALLADIEYELQMRDDARRVKKEVAIRRAERGDGLLRGMLACTTADATHSAASVVAVAVTTASIPGNSSIYSGSKSQNSRRLLPPLPSVSKTETCDLVKEVKVENASHSTREKPEIILDFEGFEMENVESLDSESNNEPGKILGFLQRPGD